MKNLERRIEKLEEAALPAGNAEPLVFVLTKAGSLPPPPGRLQILIDKAKAKAKAEGKATVLIDLLQD